MIYTFGADVLTSTWAGGGATMRLRTTLLTAGLVAGLFLGPFCLLSAWQMGLLAGVARPQPRTMTVVELLEKGPGDNAHLVLTDFTLDKPYVQEENGVRQAVWVPVVPAGGERAGVKATLFLRPQNADDVQSEAFLKARKLDVLFANALPESSIYKVKGNARLWQAFPKIDATAALFVTDPVLGAGSTTFYDGLLVVVAYVAGGGLLVGAVACAVLLFWVPAPQPATEDATEAPAGKDYERGRLAVEIPISEHRFNFWVAVHHSIKFLVLAPIPGIIGALLLSAGVSLLARGEAGSAVVSSLAGLLFLAGCVGLVNYVVSLFVDRVEEMSVCHSGLRWKRGGQAHMATWADVADVRAKQVVHTNRGVVQDIVGTIVIDFRLGSRMVLTSKVLTDFPRFANLVLEHHNRLNGPLGPDNRNEPLNRALKPGGLGPIRR